MKKFLTVLLTFTLYFNLFTTAHASANLGGWSLGNPIAQGASAIVNATKTVVINGANVIKNSTAKITPPASSVAKVLARGAAGYALSVAVEQLLGSVDWVLDPANNQIKYKIPSTGVQTWKRESGSLAPQTMDASITDVCGTIISINTASSAASGTNYKYILLNTTSSNNSVTCRIEIQTPSGTRVNTATMTYAIVGEPAKDEEKTIPLDVVAQQVINNANAGDASAQVATTAAAADIVAEAEADQTGVKARPIVNQLETNAVTESQETATGQQTKNPDKPDTYDLSLEFPVFCGWAPTVCQAAQVVITFPSTLTEWWESANQKADDWVLSISEAWTAVKDWAKSENQDDTELDIPEQEQPEIDTDISFGGECPADRQAEVNMGVGIIKLPISYEPICTTVSTAKPVLIFVGFFIAALIIGGVKTE